MDRIEAATKYYNEENFQMAQMLALEELSFNPLNDNAIDVLSAVFLKTNQSILLEKNSAKYLDTIRQVAVMLNKLKMFSQAKVFYQKALEINPRDSVGWNNLGLIYETLMEDENAKICYEKSVNVEQNYEGLYNLGIYYRKQKDTENGIKFIKKALNFKPNDKQTEYSLGMLYFMDGNFEEGYKHFLKRETHGIEFLKNFWDGKEYKDKSILVFCDYGLGDAIMYSRYFPYLKNYFKEVKVFCRKNLQALFEKSFSGISIYTDKNALNYDYCVLAMNLPYYLKMNFSMIPSSEGYLTADKKKVSEYKEKYFSTSKKKVGLFWIGGQKVKRTERARLMALDELKKITDIEDIQFYSFQVEDPFDDIKKYPQIIDLGKTFNDFSDTAAAMKNLDLFITIDSSVTHLAGALSIKTFLMLPKCSEWRWFKDEKKTVWYDSVELFCQNKLYDWSSVVDDIYKKLKNL